MFVEHAPMHAAQHFALAADPELIPVACRDIEVARVASRQRLFHRGQLRVGDAER
ncbi:MAG: hypothetical protein ABIO45_05855 [Burkholderiaceae bacterium]